MSSSYKSSLGDILIRAIKPRDRQQVLNFLRLHYYQDEPLTAGSEPQQHDKQDEEWNMSHLRHGTSFMAYRNDATEAHRSLLGVLISGPKGTDEARKLFEKAAELGPTKLGHILQFSACVERDANVFAQFNVQKVLQIHVLGVQRENRGKNIAHNLVTEVLFHSRRLRYQLVAVDCTSFYSAKLFESMGFQCINIKYYKDYVDKTGKQIFNPEPPHKCVKTFALEIKM